MPATQHGFFLIAVLDYTVNRSESELEHAYAALPILLELLIERTHLR